MKKTLLTRFAFFAQRGRSQMKCIPLACVIDCPRCVCHCVNDPDVILNLQPLINQCHERGRYHVLDYRKDLVPPLSPGDAEGMDSLLREAGLRR